jgi:hypothetical protein
VPSILREVNLAKNIKMIMGENIFHRYNHSRK